MCSWRSLERWIGDASLASCVSIRAAARLGNSLLVGDFGFRVSGDCSIIVSKAVAILFVLVSSLEVLVQSVEDIFVVMLVFPLDRWFIFEDL